MHVKSALLAAPHVNIQENLALCFGATSSSEKLMCRESEERLLVLSQPAFRDPKPSAGVRTIPAWLGRVLDKSATSIFIFFFQFRGVDCQAPSDQC